MLSSVSEGGKDRRLRNARNSGKDPGTSEETIPEGQAGERVHGLRLRKPLEEDDRKAVLGGEA